MALVGCRDCGGVVSSMAPACPRCGCPNPGGHGHHPGRVEVVDVDMRMGSMVTFMVKWSIAAIPALFILALVGMMLAVVFGGLFAGLAGGM